MWRGSRVSEDRTHHEVDGEPLYRRRFKEVLSFHEPGLAPVSRGRTWFHIRSDGKPAYVSRFDRVFGFYEHLAAVQQGASWYHIRPDGTPAYTERFEWCGNFLEGRAVVALGRTEYSHITHDGTRAYPHTFAFAGDYREGTSVVVDGDGFMQHIDEHGHPISNARFVDLGPFHKGVAPARDTEGWFHITRAGLPLYSLRFAAVEPFYNGCARAVGKDGSVSVIAEDGTCLRDVRGPVQDEVLRVSHDLVGFWKARTVSEAIRLGLFNHLPSAEPELSRNTSLPRNGLRLLLSALEERGYVRRSPNGVWRLAALGHVIKTRAGDNTGYLAEHWDMQMRPIWDGLISSLRKGEPSFRATHPEGWFAWLDKNPSEMETYQRAMELYAKIDYDCLIDKIGTRGSGIIIDAGGGTGYLLGRLLRANPKATGYLLERPSVRTLIRVPLDVKGRLLVIDANIFSGWPVKGDSVLLARVLHDWPDSSAVSILDRARKALNPGGRIHIVERVIPPGASGAGMLGLHLYLTNGGRERTLAEFQSLLHDSRLRMESDQSVRSGIHVLTIRREHG